MSESIVVRTVKKNGIEFYVSDDRKVTGMSHTGLAGFCGVTQQTISRLIDNIEANSPQPGGVPKALEHMQGQYLGVQLEGYVIENNARIVRSEICYDILWYYAFQSPSANETAKRSLKSFGGAGIHTYILLETGMFTEQTQQSEFLVLMAGIREELAKLNGFKEREENLHTHEGDKPGLGHINQEYQKRPLISGRERFSLQQWLESRGMQLNNKQLVTFSRRVASSMRTLGHKEPEKRRAYLYGKEKSTGFINVYCEEDVPIIESALKYVLDL